MSAITVARLHEALHTATEALDVYDPTPYDALQAAEAVWAYADACEKAPRPVLVWHLLRLAWQTAFNTTDRQEQP